MVCNKLCYEYNVLTSIKIKGCFRKYSCLILLSLKKKEVIIRSIIHPKIAQPSWSQGLGQNKEDL